MVSNDNIGHVFGVNPHRVDELLDLARRLYALSSDTTDFMKLMETQQLHHDGERQMLIYFFGCMRGSNAAVFGLSKLSWYQRLVLLLNPSKLMFIFK